MTMEDFQKRKWNYKFIITIMNHKTLATSEPAKILLSIQLEYQMLLYVTKFRRAVVNGEINSFFVTFKCSSLGSSSAVAHSLSTHTKTAGLGHLTSNDCRKSAATLTREVDPTMAETVANLMSHRVSTADKVYYLPDKDIEGFKVTEFLTSVYEGTLAKKLPSQ